MNFGRKIFESKKYLGLQTNFESEKSVGSKKNFGSKSFKSEKFVKNLKQK